MKNTTIKIHHSLRSAERLRKELRDQRIALEAMLKKLERQGVWWGTLTAKRSGLIILSGTSTERVA